ncbi:hypothetical protein HOLleu_34269 [Holothuria leucospilota]|uniref:Uncharacterized protein n=1 Tax=Holothuria leucospilota TaxID=206669 RepID=A0A9Q0YMX1_HOLLE|nr:hypothetical protein HOLleu_34269 [Holothuria leucospilota]
MDLFNTTTSAPVAPFDSTTEKPYRLDDPTQRLLIAIFTCTISLLGIPEIRQLRQGFRLLPVGSLTPSIWKPFATPD